MENYIYPLKVRLKWLVDLAASVAAAGRVSLLEHRV
jgi:hypothetical protein